MPGGRWAWAGLALLLAGCREKVATGPEQILPNQIVEGIVLHETDSGRRLYTLEAERALVYDAAHRVEVVRPHVTFYDEAGAVFSYLDAMEGVILSRTEDLVARRNVVVRTADSTVLRTDSLVWSNARRIVLTDASVDISTPEGEVHGQGLVSDAGLNRIEIRSEVHGRSDYDFGTGQ
jgi:LPS export ABC transporter protein LptC